MVRGQGGSNEKEKDGEIFIGTAGGMGIFYLLARLCKDILS
jgi:hypothetical protein